ncbi:MAG: FecR domain-containing protein, partial [Myxococcales bacterium]|nr:FecR domain-containing protein [Myxococcales bacterium]
MTARAAQEQQLRTLLTAGDRLDDITRARMWSRLEDQLAVPAAAPAPARWRRPAALAVAALAAAAAIVLVLRASQAPIPHDAAVVVAADATLSTRLGPHARAALVGPAELDVVGTAGDATTIRLDRGTLLADFTGGAGRSLRIEARDLVVEIVGTLFAIEVTDRTTCVSVAHGTVRVTRGASTSLVTDRQQLCSGDPAPRAIPPDIADQLARHEQALQLANTGRTPRLVTEADPPAIARTAGSDTEPPAAQVTPPAAQVTPPAAPATPPAAPATAAASNATASPSSAAVTRPDRSPPVVSPDLREPTRTATERAPSPAPNDHTSTRASAQRREPRGIAPPTTAPPLRPTSVPPTTAPSSEPRIGAPPPVSTEA